MRRRISGAASTTLQQRTRPRASSMSIKWYPLPSLPALVYSKTSGRRHFATRWVDTTAGDLHGVSVVGPTPGLVWAHGLGGSCAADDIRGIGELLNPRVLARTVLRVDLRGHGKSALLHDSARDSEQYSLPSLAKDFRLAAHASLSRSFFGGEALGAAVALQAAVTAVSKGSSDMPPGVVLMRPPAALAESSSNLDSGGWRQRCKAAATFVDVGGWPAVESWESDADVSLLNGSSAMFAAANFAGGDAARGADVSPDTATSAQGVAIEKLRLRRREDISLAAYSAALRGHAVPAPLGHELSALGVERCAMADDAYGVPLKLQCPVLVLGLASDGDVEHSVEAAEMLAARLPKCELVIARDVRQAREEWAGVISAFLRKAWMSEFLTKRVMPQ
eukprot:TRINITY_DN70827_c0_g1_i1.p1 TRINITY_DN70827_c0_g1~~TRINITY_DN70827_c0_g1_i1.p1  ORF type:complete len:392 (+),score=56.21 TRINITY_DN70827_c0_g1_i1:90-1265(+)